jgi:hypothetical protein
MMSSRVASTCICCIRHVLCCHDCALCLMWVLSLPSESRFGGLALFTVPPLNTAYCWVCSVGPPCTMKAPVPCRAASDQGCVLSRCILLGVCPVGRHPSRVCVRFVWWCRQWWVLPRAAAPTKATVCICVSCIPWLAPLGGQTVEQWCAGGVECQQLLLYGTRKGACRGGASHGVGGIACQSCRHLSVSAVQQRRRLHVACHHGSLLWDGSQSKAGINSVRSCVRMHGGWVHLESKGQGAPWGWGIVSSGCFHC